MLQQKARRTASTGFTIVELLIVIIVIAILAAIVIVAYNGISRNAARSVLKNDTAQLLRQLQNYRTNSSEFPATLSMVGGGPASIDTEYEYDSTSTTFCVTASSQKAQLSYKVTETGAIEEGVCSGHSGLNPPQLVPTDMLAVGYYHVCSLAFDEVASCWGKGSDGQLGTGGTSNYSKPFAIPTPNAMSGKRVTAVAAGQAFSCAVAGGKAYCWGSQMLCQLGADGCTSFNDFPNIPTPTAVSTAGALAGKTVTKISTGSSHACALADGIVYCWGAAQNGKLGGSTGGYASTSVSMPVNSFSGTTILDGKTVTALSAGDDTTCIVADGKAYCWGLDLYGQLGNGTDDSALTTSLYSRIPVAVDTTGVLSGKTVTDISTGANYDFTCAVADGAAYCWGRGTSGQHGDGQLVDTESPVAVDTTGVLNGKTVTDISVGNNDHACVIANARAYCWGVNTAYGKLGDGTTVDHPLPVAVDTSGVLNGVDLAAIQAGYSSTCALSIAGEVYCWGQNGHGRLGNDSAASLSTTPVKVLGF